MWTLHQVSWAQTQVANLQLAIQFCCHTCTSDHWHGPWGTMILTVSSFLDAMQLSFTKRSLPSSFLLPLTPTHTGCVAALHNALCVNTILGNSCFHFLHCITQALRCAYALCVDGASTSTFAELYFSKSSLPRSSLLPFFPSFLPTLLCCVLFINQHLFLTCIVLQTANSAPQRKYARPRPFFLRKLSPYVFRSTCSQCRGSDIWKMKRKLFIHKKLELLLIVFHKGTWSFIFTFVFVFCFFFFFFVSFPQGKNNTPHHIKSTIETFMTVCYPSPASRIQSLMLPLHQVELGVGAVSCLKSTENSKRCLQIRLDVF